MEKYRLQKVLAEVGLGSRREIETWIRAGRLSINNKIAQLGDKVGHKDTIKLDGRIIKAHSPSKHYCDVLLYHKPEGEVCTRSDPEGRATVFQKLPKPRQGRWIMIGSLDLNTSGLLLFTNDGELAKRLMHPSYQVEHEYAVRILGVVSNEMIQRMQTGVQLEDGKANFKQINFAGGTGANKWYNIVISESRQHEVRRLWESQGVKVSRLIRTRFGYIHLPRSLHLGKAERLPEKQVDKLRLSVELS